MKSLHCVIEGKVRGGTFQSWVHETADRMGLAGWVRNVADGKAEIMLQGSGEAFSAFEDALRTQAPLAEIKDIRAEVVDYDKTFSGFEMRG